MKTILAPVDFSNATAGVIEEAARLAKAMRMRVALVNVLTPPSIPLITNGDIVDLTPLMVAARKSAKAQLVRLASGIKANKVDVSVIQADGFASDQILAASRRLGAVYIVVGSHGHGGLYDLVVGSTTHAVLRRARCPVIVVRAAKR